MYSYQWPETCKLKFKVWALNFLSVYTFLWCFLFPLIEEHLKRKTEEAKVLLYSEKEHEKYKKQRCMNPSPLAHQTLICTLLHSSVMPSLPWWWCNAVLIYHFLSFCSSDMYMLHLRKLSIHNRAKLFLLLLLLLFIIVEYYYRKVVEPKLEAS